MVYTYSPVKHQTGVANSNNIGQHWSIDARSDSTEVEAAAAVTFVVVLVGVDG